MSDREHVHLLIDVARRYYLQNQSQRDIAQSIGYSRSMVSRMLSEAKQRGIVTFSIDHPLEQALDLEQQLRKVFGLTQCRVSASRESHKDVSRLAADLITELVTSDTVLSMTNGHTVASVVRELRRRRHPNATVIQALGTISQENQMINSPELCRMLADQLGTQYRLLPAPLVVSSPSLASSLKREGSIAMTLSMASHADVLITSVGVTNAHEYGSIFDGLIRPEEHTALLKSGCVGHICAHHIDGQGHHVDNQFCQRLIALPFSRLYTIPNVMVVAWGEEKVPALRAALRGGFVNTLVTDMSVAELLLETPQPSTR